MAYQCHVTFRNNFSILSSILIRPRPRGTNFSRGSTWSRKFYNNVSTALGPKKVESSYEKV